MKIVDKDILEIVNEPLNWDEFNGKHILITGAAGMVGSYLTKTFEYLKENMQIDLKLTLLVRDKTKLKEKAYIKILEQDVVEPIDVVDKLDYIIHAASPASPLIMKSKPVDTFKANVLGTINCLELAKQNKAKFIFISSREVYGAPLEVDEFTESDLGLIDHFEARASYSEGKKASETLCASYASQFSVESIVLRLAHTYGPGININDGRVQSDFLKNYINEETIKLNSDGSSIRTYTYIKDAITGIFFAVLKGTSTVYNISNDREKTSILELAKTIAKINGKELQIDFIKSNEKTSYSPVKFGTLNSTKLERLGWKPTVSVAQGFKRTVDYLMEKNNE